MNSDRITIIPIYGNNGANLNQLFLEVEIDGVPCGRLLIAAGHRHDIIDLMTDELTLPELAKKWDKR